MPWGNPRQKSGNFVAHLNLRHKFVYETYVVCRWSLVIRVQVTQDFSSLLFSIQDYDQDEDAVLQEALRASLSDS